MTLEQFAVRAALLGARVNIPGTFNASLDILVPYKTRQNTLFMWKTERGVWYHNDDLIPQTVPDRMPYEEVLNYIAEYMESCK